MELTLAAPVDEDCETNLAEMHLKEVPQTTGAWEAEKGDASAKEKRSPTWPKIIRVSAALPQWMRRSSGKSQVRAVVLLMSREQLMSLPPKRHVKRVEKEERREVRLAGKMRKAAPWAGETARRAEVKVRTMRRNPPRRSAAEAAKAMTIPAAARDSSERNRDDRARATTRKDPLRVVAEAARATKTLAVARDNSKRKAGGRATKISK